MKIKLALIQADLVWENPKENLKSFDKQLSNLATDVEIVILPEVFATGFTMTISKFGDSIGIDAFNWLKQKAKTLDKIFVGSLLVKEKGNYYNRMYWVRPDGSFEYYDKRHLFQMGDEHKVMTAGNKRVVVEHKGVKFMLQTCYDLRFPLLYREMVKQGAEIFLIPAAFTHTTGEIHWESLIRARAIENQCYVIAPAQGGYHVNGRHTYGHSMTVDYLGQIHSSHLKGNGVVSINIDLNAQQKLRNSFPVLKHAKEHFYTSIT